MPFLLLLSCQIPKSNDECVTTCGMRYMGMANGQPDPGYTKEEYNRDWPQRSCEEFQRAESWILKNSANVGDNRINQEMCKRLKGWAVYTNPEFAWIDNWGRGVAGLTFCFSSVSEINNEPFTTSSLAHELYHAAQRCDPINHLGWDVNGIYEAVNKTNFLLPDAGWPE